MVTIDGTPRQKQGGTFEFDFTGLSTDDKPVEAHENMPIANGSSFFEIDTKKIKFYDEGGKSWL